MILFEKCSLEQIKEEIQEEKQVKDIIDESLIINTEPIHQYEIAQFFQ